MSNFVLTNNKDKFNTAVRKFTSRGLKESSRISFDNILFASFSKRSIENENFLLLRNNDFICSVGAFVYNGNVGKFALNDAYNSFNDDIQKLHNNSVFQGTLIIRKNSNVTIFCDKYNVYWTYYFNKNGIYYVSSSLSSVIQALDKKVLNVNRFIEAFTQKGSRGRKMFYDHVFRLFGNEQINIKDNSFCIKSTQYKNGVYDFSDASIDEIVKEFSELLLSTVESVHSAFGNQIGIHQSGGFDSRLILSACIKLGYKPTLLYALGNTPLTSQYEQDRLIVDKIGKKFGLKVYNMDWCIDNLIGKEETRTNFDKYGFNCNENYCNNSWYREYSENVGSYAKVLFDGHMGETLNIECEDGIFGDTIPEEFDMNSIFDEYQKIFFNCFYWRSAKQKSDHVQYLKNELMDLINGTFKLPYNKNIMNIEHYQKYWHMLYRPADAHPTNLFNDFFYSYSLLGIPKLHDFVLDIPFNMIRKRRFSIKIIDYLVPGFSKISLFSRAGLTKIEKGEVVRIAEKRQEILKKLHKMTPSLIINKYRGIKKFVITEKNEITTPMWDFYVSWLKQNDLLRDIFDFDKQTGDVRRLATTAIYADAVDSLGYDDVVYESKS